MITYYVPGMEETKMYRHCSYPQGVHRQVQVKLMPVTDAVVEIGPMQSHRGGCSTPGGSSKEVFTDELIKCSEISI